jgi:hypothetical protein
MLMTAQNHRLEWMWTDAKNPHSEAAKNPAALLATISHTRSVITYQPLCHLPYEGRYRSVGECIVDVLDVLTDGLFPRFHTVDRMVDSEGDLFCRFHPFLCAFQ